MNDIKYFKNKQDEKFVVSTEPLVCDQCSGFCNDFIILKQYFHKGRVKRFICCSNLCSKKIQFIGDVEVGTYLINNSIEKDFIFIQPEKFDFQFSNKINCFEAAKLECKTVDKTVYSNRGALIDESVEVVELESKDKNLSIEEGLVLLDELANPKNLVTQEKRKLLK